MGQIRHHVEMPQSCVDDLASGSTDSASGEVTVIHLDSHSTLNFMPFSKNTPKYDNQWIKLKYIKVKG